MKPVILLCVILCSHVTLVRGSCKGCLILTPYINKNATAARHMSAVEPTEYLGIESYSGFITVKPKYNSNLFFWFFPAPEIERSPWIIWLQGGPGISSMMGLFDIIGPIRIEDGKVKLRNVTWVGDYSVLFLDNPVGAGFSFTENDRGYPNNEDDIGEQMLTFVQQFLQMFPELRNAPLFIAGESYAGKYVPALAIQIHRYNKKTQGDHNPINLKGISIGNGLIEMRPMMRYSELCESLGLIEGPAIAELKELESTVMRLIDEQNMVAASNKFNETIEFIKKQTKVSVYNFNEDPSSSAPLFEHYLNRQDVRQLIHVGNATFDFNNQLVYTKMLPDISNSTKPWVEELLDYYGVLLYHGQLDIILPYSLAKHLYATFSWLHREAFDLAPRRRLRRFTNGSVVGYKRSGGNLVEVLVRRAGHMVPYDQPEVGKFIIDGFINQFK